LQIPALLPIYWRSARHSEVCRGGFTAGDLGVSSDLDRRAVLIGDFDGVALGFGGSLRLPWKISGLQIFPDFRKTCVDLFGVMDL
jgi:hypothetical protein